MNCKLIGSFVQHLEVTLDPGEEFYGQSGSMIYHEQGIDIDVNFNGRGLGRIIGAKLSGESLFLMHFVNRSAAPRRMAIGSRCSLHPLRLEGQSAICRKGSYVASSRRVDIDSMLSLKGLLGGLGLLLQRVSGNATVFLDCNGTPIVRDLTAGETIAIDENHLVAMLGIDDSRISSRWSARNMLAGEGIALLQITGPGKVVMSPGTFFVEPAR